MLFSISSLVLCVQNSHFNMWWLTMHIAMCNMDSRDQKCILLCAIWIWTKNVAMCNMDSRDQKWRLKLRRRRHLWSVRDWVFSTSNTKGAVECVWPGLLIWTWSFQFFYRNMHAAIYNRNMHIATCNMRAVCILRCNIDSFLLNQKGLESMSILHKKLCNMHIARRNMHIAIESILPIKYIT